MAYPLNTEGLVQESTDPVGPLTEELAASGDLETDAAGVESAPTLSNEAREAVDRLAEHIREGRSAGPH